MKLVIIEGPGKRDTLKKYLGDEYEVVATKGHIRDLPERAFGVNLNSVTPTYEIIADKQPIIAELQKKQKKATGILLATDPDREGEAISWHIASVLGINPTEPCRIEFQEISKKAVQKALTEPRNIDLNLVNAQQTRRILDRTMGYKLSPILSKRVSSSLPLSAGRVQSVALRMVVEREEEIKAFVPEEYWNTGIEVSKQKDPMHFKAALALIDGKKAKISCKEESDAVAKAVAGKKLSVSSIKKSQTSSHAPAPFITSSLQQDALNKLGMSLKRTSASAQALYEGVELKGEGKVALITYIRTDSTRISPDAQKEARDYIANNFGARYVPEKPNVYKTKASAQDAHEAIRPITLERTPDQVKESLSPDLFRLYKLIYDRFLASQMANAIYDNVNVDIEVEKFTFRAIGKTLVFPGFTAAYKFENEDEKEEQTKLPPLEEKEPLDFHRFLAEQKFTKPPSRFTEASLVKEMEEQGIGRPATYAATITTLDSRHYTEKEGKYIKPTSLGTAVNQYLMSHFTQVINIEFTAEMETDLDQIAEGQKDWQAVVKTFWESFSILLERAGAEKDYIKVEAEKSDVVCDKCGSPMMIRQGRYGKFLGCSAYPKCTNIMKTEPSFTPKPVGKCPDCGKDIIAKKSKQGKLFFGCTGYPECKFYSWTKPKQD